ncbi:MAG: PHP domain-containing protein [Endomicrobiales bacterium]
MNFKLHCHFEGSYSDSALRFDEALKKIKALGQKAVALTDHGEILFAHRFEEACRANGIKPIFGAELYFVEDAAESIEKEANDRFHLVGQALARHGAEAGEKVLNRYRAIFGDDFHIEVGRHHIDEEEKINASLLALAKKFSLAPVLTNDVHYLDAGDWLAHDVIMKTRYDKVTEFVANSRHYWLKDPDEMAALGFPAAYLEQTEIIADQCEDLSLSALLKESVPLKGAPDAEALIASGKAAHVSRVVPIDAAAANRHVKDIFKEDKPALAARITGIPRRSEPDCERVAFVRDRPLKEVIPLKINRGKICTQWDEDSCRKAGALILPFRSSPFAAKLWNFFK